MHRFRLTARAIVSLALALLLWIISFLGRDQFERLFKEYYPWLPMNQVLYLAGAAALAIVVFVGVWSILRDVSEWLIKFYAARWAPEIQASFGTAADIPAVLQFGAQFYDDPENLIHSDIAAAFVEACPKTLRIFHRKGELVGFYFLFAINRRAVDEILTEVLRSAQQLNARHTVKSFKHASGVYVPNICAKVGIARGKVMVRLEQDLLEIIRDGRSMRYIFGRGANAKGLYYYGKYHFKPIGNSDLGPVIWVKTLEFKI